MQWIPIDEQLPQVNSEGYSDYILVSFDNFPLPDIAEYRTDEEGGGAFHPGDEEKTYSSFGVFVNAWMPLPKCYEEG